MFAAKPSELGAADEGVIEGFLAFALCRTVLLSFLCFLDLIDQLILANMTSTSLHRFILDKLLFLANAS